MNKSILILLIVILMVGCAIRLVNINQPLLEYNSTRQVETAMIVRNFMTGGFNFLYPEIDENGRGPSYLMQEFPIITAPLSVICSFIRKTPEWALRSSSVLFFIPATLLLYRLTRRYYGDMIALISSSIFVFSPLSILLSRAFQPDMAMIFFIIVCFYYFLRWQDDLKLKYYIFSVIGLIGAVLLKITNLYMVIPLLFISLASGKNKGLNYWMRVSLFFIIAMIPIWWWWGYHTVKVRELFPISQTSTFSTNYIISSAKFFLTYLPFYKEIFRYVIMAALTPLVFLLFLYGLFFLRGDNRRDNFLYIWLASVILFFMAVPEQSKQEYYMLSIIPVASIFAAKGIVSVFEKMKRASGAKIVLSVCILLTILSVVYVVLPKYLNRPIYAHIVEAGKTVDGIAEKDALVIASHGYGPDLLYYCNRKGWGFLIDRGELKKYLETVKTDFHEGLAREISSPAAELESLRKKGASYFVIVDTNELGRNTEFNDYITRNYRCIKRSGTSYMIFDLRKKLAS